MKTPFLFAIPAFALALAPSLGSAASAPNFAEDIAPIVFQNCTSCHRPGQAGPFPLTNYAETKKRARLMAEVTESRTMPPWHPDEGCGEFVGERRLTKTQIQLLKDWAAAGAPEGPAGKTPKLPDFPEGWLHGKPDMVLTMDEAFTVPADGPDIYRQFVIPLNLGEDKWVQAIEVKPGSKGALHHVLLWLDSSGAARKLDEEDAGSGFRKMGFRRTGSLGGWAVGGGPRSLPDGLAYPLPKGSDLILSSHFHPTGKEEQEKTSIAIYFARQPPTRQLVAQQLPALFGRGAGLDIPAGDAAYTIKDHLTLPVDTDLIAVGAHAHYLGKTMEATAKLPDGTSKTLFRISDWDFQWQDQYVYKQPVRLPAGTVVEATIVWDNSSGNPNNPSSPPRRVTWGEESQDEMGSISFVTVAANTWEHPSLANLSKERMRGVFGSLVKETGASFLVSQRLQMAGLLDKNGDKMLSADELPERLKKSRVMNLLDKNGDGALDAEELKQAREAWRPMPKESR